MKKYNIEFKRMLVTMYEEGKQVTELCREYELSRPTLYSWIKAYGSIKTSDGEITSNDDIARLRKELAKVREENEVLKKCVTIFSKR